jgi:hypothetical protein
MLSNLTGFFRHLDMLIGIPSKPANTVSARTVFQLNTLITSLLLTETPESGNLTTGEVAQSFLLPTPRLNFTYLLPFNRLRRIC